ncbi:MAG: FTR1 family iron permease [Candidatus Hodarchaeales archaeon]|jgi:high-affinity iron transporter
MQELELISFSSFVITLRETIEAALIVGIVLAYLTKTNNKNLRKDVWIGVFVAILASVVGAMAFLAIYGGFEGNTERLFEGIVMVLAAVVLTSMILWNFRHAKEIKAHLEDKVQDVISGNKRFAIFSLIFIAVFREGIETVLFLGGINANEPQSAILFSGTLGIIIAIIFATVLFQGSLNLNLKTFFNVTSVILILFAAGLLSHGLHEFQELNWFGVYGTENAPFWNIALWDMSSILNDKEGIGSLLRALVGYQDKPTLLEIIGYIGYIIVVGLIYFRIKITEPDSPSPKAFPTQ